MTFVEANQINTPTLNFVSRECEASSLKSDEDMGITWNRNID